MTWEKIRETLTRTIFTAVVLAVGLIPLWIYLLAKLVFSPEGFWQNLVLAGIGIYFLGAFQLVFLGFALFLIYYIWTS